MTKIKDALIKDIRQRIINMMLSIGISKERITAFTMTNEKKMAEPMRLMIDSIRKSYPLLHSEELTRAFDLALQEKFEVNTRLYNRDFNFEYVSKILNAYIKFMHPLRKKQQQVSESANQTPAITEDQKKSMVQKGIETAYQNYKHSGIMPETCAWIYNILRDNQGITHTEDEERQIDTEAREMLKNLLEAKRKAINKNSVKEMTLRLNDLDNDPLLPGMKKTVALKNYWNELIISEQL